MLNVLTETSCHTATQKLKLRVHIWDLFLWEICIVTYFALVTTLIVLQHVLYQC